jgi:gluconolactonase
METAMQLRDVIGPILLCALFGPACELPGTDDDPPDEPIGGDPLANRGEVQMLSTGHGSVGGLAWSAARGELLFSDGFFDQILAVSGVDAPPSIVKDANGYPSGLFAVGEDLLVCEIRGRRVTRSLADGTSYIVADAVEGGRFNAPRDIVERSDGRAFFTDPSLDAAERDLAFQGVFSVDSEGNVDVGYRELVEPTGIALSQDESRLFVADLAQGSIVVFPVGAEGGLGAPTSFASGLTEPGGLAFGPRGHLFVATADGVRVFDAEGADGGTLELPEPATHVRFGRGGTLYAASATSIFTVDLPNAR